MRMRSAFARDLRGNGCAGVGQVWRVKACAQASCSAGEVDMPTNVNGVGSVAVAVLAKLGYDVAASTGRAETHDYLRELGASSILERAELAEAGRPLGKERWIGGVDTIGSQTLATVLSQTQYRGAVAACGLVGGNDLPTTVLPFILRNVTLLGIDSVMAPIERRRELLDTVGKQIGVDNGDLSPWYNVTSAQMYRFGIEADFQYPTRSD